MRRLLMILLVLVIPLTASGLVQFIPPGGGGSGGGGGGGAQAPSFTVATRPTGVPVGTVIAVIDGANAQDCAVGGGTSVVQCRWNGSAWLAFGDGSTAGSGGAPDNAPYVTLAPVAGLLAEQALSPLATGILLNTTGTGVPTIYAGSGAPANQFVRSLSPSGVATFAGVAETDLLFAVATQAELDAVQGTSAPLTAPFVTTVPVAGLPGEQALSTLTTGLLRNTTGTGVPTIYAGTTCPNGFPRSLNAEGGADCQSVAEADLTFAAATQPELDALQASTQGQIDVITAAQLGYHVKALQAVAEGGTVDCTHPAGQFIGAIAPVQGAGLLTALGTLQVSGCVSNTQFCLVLGQDDEFPVPLQDGFGLRLAQNTSQIILDSRGSVLLQCRDSVWRQVDQAGVVPPGMGPEGLQANCGVNCQLANLPESAPYIIAPADNPSTLEIEGPQQHIFSPDGNWYEILYSAPGIVAGPRVINIVPDTCWTIQAVLGLPLADTIIGSACNQGGVSMGYTGIFAETPAPTASAVSITAVPSLTATNVQQALEELAQGGGLGSMGTCGTPTNPTMSDGAGTAFEFCVEAGTPVIRPMCAGVECTKTQVMNLILRSQGTKPTCDATYAALNTMPVWVTTGIGGVATKIEVCAKDAADVYAWTAMAMGPSGPSSGVLSYPFSCNDANATNTLFLSYGSNGAVQCSTGDSLATNTEVIVTRTGVIGNLYCRSSAQATPNNFVYTARINIADTALTCTITGATSTCTNVATQVAITAGNRLSLKVVTSADVSVQHYCAVEVLF